MIKVKHVETVLMPMKDGSSYPQHTVIGRVFEQGEGNFSVCTKEVQMLTSPYPDGCAIFPPKQ